MASYSLSAGAHVEMLFAGGSDPLAAISLTGNELANNVYGNNGANTLDGGAGSDVLIGYGGADNFRFTKALGSNNLDSILDFQSGTDKIELAADVFQGLAKGALSAEAFASGSASSAAHRILYNSATGALSFDQDGNGAGAAVQFAVVTPGTQLQSSDFFVI